MDTQWALLDLTGTQRAPWHPMGTLTSSVHPYTQ